MTLQVETKVQWELDSKASQFNVQAFAEGLASVLAHCPKFAIRDFVGAIEGPPASLNDASLCLRVAANSLELMDHVTPDDRRAIDRMMFNEVLETRIFPEVRFESTRVLAARLSENMHRVTMTGNLTIHGVTNQHAIVANVVTSDDTLRAYGETQIRQSDYGIAKASVAGGTLKVRDELKFGFFLIARRRN